MSALIVPLPLPQAIERFRLAHVPTAARGMPPHVTLLYPFVPAEAVDDEVRSLVARVVAAHAPLEFRLAGVSRWPTSAHLTVEPAAPFESLVADLVAVFPQYPPYAGEYPFVPHVSLAEDDPSTSLDPIAPDLDRLATLPQRATEVTLIARLRGRWVKSEAFPLLGA